MSLSAERIESLKAGILAAVSFTLAYSLVVVCNGLVLAEQVEEFTVLQMTVGINLLLKLAIAGLSGFLFGVTYRYVIRDDQNPHLKNGAVFAFGLVRGLAPVEVQQKLTNAVWIWCILGIESIVCFAIARLALDWAIHRHWVKPFKSS